MTTKTGKRLVWGQTLGGSEKWLDMARDSNGYGPSKAARIVNGQDLADAIDENSRVVRQEAILDAIKVLSDRVTFYEERMRINDTPEEYWRGSLETTRILVRELQVLRDRSWSAKEDGPNKDAADVAPENAADAPKLKAAEETPGFTIKVPV